jgi:periplasmic protein TonB
MRLSIWLAAVMIATSGCAATYESERGASPPTAGPTEARPAAILSQPGCQEPAHQPFPERGSYVAVDELPEAITKVPPEYPATTGIGVSGGTVLVHALVCEHGHVVEAVAESTDRLAGDAARQAIMRWKFRPAQSGGRPVATWVDAPMTFTAR